DFFFQAEDGIRDRNVTGVQTCALPICMELIDVVLPCLDEAAALPGVLRALPTGYRAIVVDNGSRDGSPEVAAAHGATVVHEARKIGRASCRESGASEGVAAGFKADEEG